MAGGWAQDGAVNEQIEVSTQEALARARGRQPTGESLRECADCGEPIPEPRRVALPGVKLCIDCQEERDRARKPAAGINRRASKDSQLK
ncbi:DksA/TraR family C4-type zinc finger protein [Paracoccus sp. Z118]|uniref:DksA/TraR family C4-type zinc finger protein n=1 Tax=Paracoccus sp. Z118 TaxID=2851017 RepID=UPI001C2C9644|nr:DksA/TraR family C4-type zinc finger protein [Paracoccus sp. Z118]MBV0890508.1 DksA/TraR family C4-type zinc finger protein [Paracoccus sp. Z118]